MELNTSFDYEYVTYISAEFYFPATYLDFYSKLVQKTDTREKEGR